jgi:ribonuclease P protein component
VIARRRRIPGPQLPVFKGKTIARSSLFILKAASDGLAHSRFAVVVGKNVDPRSVRRHAWKRRIAAQLAARDFGPYDIVIIVLPDARTILPKDIVLEFQKFLMTTRMPVLNP